MSSNSSGDFPVEPPDDVWVQDVGKIIRAARLRLEMSQEELGRLTGVSRSAVNQWESGKTIPEAERLPQIASALGIEGSTLLGLSTGKIRLLVQPKGAGHNSAPATSSVVASPPPVPYRTEMPRDLPIRGTVSGGPGGLFQMANDEVADWARRPPRLEGRKDVFGLWVEDSSMVPAFKPGALIIVERKPPAIGDDVVVELAPESDRDDLRAILKIYLGRTSAVLRLTQHNPVPDKPIEIPLARVISIHRVLTMAELFGV